MLDIELFLQKDILFDQRYKLIRPLSTDGGTADVWLAIDTLISSTMDTDGSKIESEDDFVALKIYRPKNALDIDGERIFKDEYKIVQKCKHTNLLRPSHYSIFEGTPYLEIPYCKNGSSERLIGKKLHDREYWRFIEEVAEGLAFLHSQHPPIIHQDIKPGNILIDDEGKYVITDFGISTTKGLLANDYSLDEEYSGTMAYMAPERFNENPMPLPESDIWAFGVTLYEILCNNVPFGDYGGESQLKENNYNKLPKTVSKDIRKLIDSCINIDPQNRPTAKEIANIAREHIIGQTNKNKNLLLIIVIPILLAVGIYKCKDNDSGSLPPIPPYPIYVEKDIVLEDTTIFEDMRKYTYKGVVNANGLPNGEGEATFLNGNVYKGQFANGICEDSTGKAMFTFNNKDKFVGTFKGGYFEKGKYTCAEDKYYFEGTFRLMTPYNGVWYKPDGDKFYTIKDGKEK